jgi:hypothetical protein
MRVVLAHFVLLELMLANTLVTKPILEMLVALHFFAQLYAALK